VLQDFLREKPTIYIRPAVGSKWKITGAGEPSSRSSYYRYFFFAAFFFLAFFLAAIIVSLRVVDCFNVQKILHFQRITRQQHQLFCISKTASECVVCQFYVTF